MAIRPQRAIVGALVVLVWAGSAPPGVADMTVTFRDSWGTTGGGEFLLTPTGFPFVPGSLGENPGEFETFCLEVDEFMNFRDTFHTVVNTEAVRGGTGGADPLDPMTAFLYNEFLIGNLAATGYDYADSGIGRVASANALQRTFWFIEGEETSLPAGLATTFYNAAYAAVVTNATWQGLGNVRVLNMWRDAAHTQHAQDQLVLIPVPGALVLGALGLTLLGRVTRTS